MKTKWPHLPMRNTSRNRREAVLQDWPLATDETDHKMDAHMTWNSAKSDAEKRLPDLIKSARADRVRLVDFDSEETYYFLKEGEPQRSALSYHRMVNNALKRLLSRQKIKVDLVTITRAYYSLWLKEHTLTDSLENRTRFLREIL